MSNDPDIIDDDRAWNLALDGLEDVEHRPNVDVGIRRKAVMKYARAHEVGTKHHRARSPVRDAFDELNHDALAGDVLDAALRGADVHVAKKAMGAKVQSAIQAKIEAAGLVDTGRMRDAVKVNIWGRRRRR